MHLPQLTPEESIKCQNEIGADIIMQLDDVVSSTNPDFDRFKEATARSVRWLDRCIQVIRSIRTLVDYQFCLFVHPIGSQQKGRTESFRYNSGELSLLILTT